MMFNIDFTDSSKIGISKLKRSEPDAYKKLCQLLEELQVNPFSGTGKPKQLGGDRQGQWSRRITQKHRLVYEIKENTVTVLVTVFSFIS